MTESMITVNFTKTQLERYMKGGEAIASPLSDDNTFTAAIPMRHIVKFGVDIPRSITMSFTNNENMITVKDPDALLTSDLIKIDETHKAAISESDYYKEIAIRIAGDISNTVYITSPLYPELNDRYGKMGPKDADAGTARITTSNGVYVLHDTRFLIANRVNIENMGRLVFINEDIGFGIIEFFDDKTNRYIIKRCGVNERVDLARDEFIFTW